jgi:hypothetical protein
MNESGKELQHDEAQWFDLLADGELDEQRRRELLSRLDDQPGGWRRCALAFLEAQSWQRELGDWAADAKTQAPAAAASVVDSRSRSWGLGSWLAVAASFVAAFGLGLFLRDAGRQHGAQPVDQVAIGARQSPGLDTNSLVRQEEYGPRGLPGGGVMTMSFRPGPDGQLQEIQVPFVDDPAISADWLAERSSAMPLEVLKDLQRSGHQVEQSRQLVPVDLHDGRRVVVPVDHLNIHYVGNRSYQ